MAYRRSQSLAHEIDKRHADLMTREYLRLVARIEALAERWTSQRQAVPAKTVRRQLRGLL